MERTTWRRINLSESVSNEADAYDPEDDVALGGYTGSLLTYGLAVAALVTAGGATGRSLPERYRVTDVVLGGVATYKFTRLLGKASVTSPLRAPFTTFNGAAGSAEHHEQARGEGARHTVGELLTCPFCLGQWVGTGYVAALVLAPRSARTWAALFSVTAISDGLQHAYARLRTA